MSNELRDKVLGAIKNGKVKMRPKWHYVLKTALAITGGVLLSLALLYLVSFIFFALRANGVWFMPAFGLSGMRTFVMSLPWLLIFTSLLFIIILEILVKRYAFAYRKPLLYSVLGILALAIIGGFALARAPFHRSLLRRAQEDRSPLTAPFYREFGMHRFHDIHPGYIASITEDGFILYTRQGETFTVRLVPETRLPFGFNFAEGDEVVVFGDRDDDTVEARGILEIDDEMMEPRPYRNIPPRMMRPPSPR